MKVFETACKELDEMHETEIYMKDIKPENMVFQEGVNGQDGVARHIDLDSVVTPNHGNYKEVIYTDGYSTYELILQKSDKNIETVKKGLKSNDQFAMLLTLMFATGGDNINIVDDITEFENIMGKQEEILQKIIKNGSITT